VDFELTDEQRLLQDTVRRFVDDRILPNAIENDINHHLDLGAIEGMAELGILGIVIPEEYGGAGLDFVCEALACEEIERGEAAFRTLVSVHVGLRCARPAARTAEGVAPGGPQAHRWRRRPGAPLLVRALALDGVVPAGPATSGHPLIRGDLV